MKQKLYAQKVEDHQEKGVYGFETDVFRINQNLRTIFQSQDLAELLKLVEKQPQQLVHTFGQFIIVIELREHPFRGKMFFFNPLNDVDIALDLYNACKETFPIETRKAFMGEFNVLSNNYSEIIEVELTTEDLI